MYYQLQPSDEDDYLDALSLACTDKMLEDVNLTDSASSGNKFTFYHYDFAHRAWARVKPGFELQIPSHRTIFLRSLEVDQLGEEFEDLLDSTLSNTTSHQPSNMNNIPRQRNSIREQQRRAATSAAPPPRSQSTELAKPSSDGADKGKGIDYSHLRSESSLNAPMRGYRSISPGAFRTVEAPSTPSPQRRTQSLFSPHGPKPALKPLSEDDEEPAQAREQDFFNLESPPLKERANPASPTGRVTIKVETIDLTLESPSPVSDSECQVVGMSSNPHIAINLSAHTVYFQK